MWSVPATSQLERCMQQSYLLHTPYFFPAAGKRISCHPLNHQCFLPGFFKYSFIIPYTNFWGHCYFLVREDQSLKFRDFFLLSSTSVLLLFFSERGTSDISKQHICCMLAQKKLSSCLCTFPQKTPPKLAALKKNNLISQKHKDTNYFKARPCKIKPTIKYKRLGSENPSLIIFIPQQKFCPS